MGPFIPTGIRRNYLARAPRKAHNSFGRTQPRPKSRCVRGQTPPRALSLGRKTAFAVHQLGDAGLFFDVRPTPQRATTRRLGSRLQRPAFCHGPDRSGVCHASMAKTPSKLLRICAAAHPCASARPRGFARRRERRPHTSARARTQPFDRKLKNARAARMRRGLRTLEPSTRTTRRLRCPGAWRCSCCEDR